jgi:hypothetical protein
MTEKRLFSLLILISCSLSAQIKGVVKDSLTGKPIPYVNIWVENENIGTTSEENGQFNIDVKEVNKNLIFSAIGYDRKLIKISETNEVSLKSITYQLSEVVVSKSIGLEEIEVGNFNKKELISSYGSGKAPWIVAKYFSPTEEIMKHQFLKSIKFQTKSEIKGAKFILHFYQVNEDGSPGDDLLAENLIVEVDKGANTNTINIKKSCLKFPENGLFIAIEWMMINENRYSFSFFLDGSKEKLEGIFYEPKISSFFSETNTTWKYASGKWNKMVELNNLHYRQKKYQNKFQELAIIISLTN